MAFGTGPISFSALASYYGKSYPVSLSQMYRGINDVWNEPQNYGIPSSGRISFSQFRNSNHFLFDTTTVYQTAVNLCNQIPTSIEMPPYSGNDHWASFTWTGTSWILTSQDSYGSGDAYGNTMRSILPSFFQFFTTISEGATVPTGNGNNNLETGTKYTSIQGYIVNGVTSLGYSNSETMTFNYLNAIFHGMSNYNILLYPIINFIDFSGSRANFLNGMLAYQNWLYTN